MKMFRWIVYLCVLGTLQITQAANYTYNDGDPNNHDWTFGLNWAGKTVPTSPIDHLYFVNGTCIADSSVSASLGASKHFYVGYGESNDANFVVTGANLNAPTGYLMIGYSKSTDCYFQMDGGSLNAAGGEGVGIGWEGRGTAVISGGTINAFRLQIPKNKAANPGGNSMTVHGGTVNVTEYCLIAPVDTAGGNNRLQVDGGQLTINNYLWMSYDDAYLTVSGNGRVVVNGEIRIGRIAGGVSTISVSENGSLFSGGVMTVGSGIDAFGVLNITGGELVANTDIDIVNAGTGGSMTVSGGVVSCVGNLILHRANSVVISGGTCLFGGIAAAADAEKAVLLNITGGSVICAGDERASLAGMIQEGQIAGAGVAGAIRLEYDAVSDSTFLIPDQDVLKQAKYPVPGTNSTIPLEHYNATVLSWTAGAGAVSHDLFFGTDYKAVSGGDASVFRGHVTASSYAPGDFERDRIYYWRVDEVQSDGSVIKGSVWAFYVAAYYEIDDVEGYGADPNLMAAVWTGTNADLSLELRWKYEGGYSLRFLSTADQATATWNRAGTVSFEDLKKLGIQSLKLMFVGGNEHNPEAGNPAQTWKVVLTDGNGNSAEVIYADPATITYTDKWYEWVIDLNDFGGIDMHAIDTIAVSVPYGQTLMLLDKIRLVGMDCAAGMSPATDLNHDCVVNMDDLAIVAHDWLNTVLDRGVDKAPVFVY